MLFSIRALTCNYTFNRINGLQNTNTSHLYKYITPYKQLGYLYDLIDDSSDLDQNNITMAPHSQLVIMYKYQNLQITSSMTPMILSVDSAVNQSFICFSVASCHWASFRFYKHFMQLAWLDSPNLCDLRHERFGTQERRWKPEYSLRRWPPSLRFWTLPMWATPKFLTVRWCRFSIFFHAVSG